MERFTRAADGAATACALIIGKGGLREGSLAAFRELGGAYLAIVGGTAALETTWIEAIEDVDLDDLNPESLWRFRIRDFGPAARGAWTATAAACSPTCDDERAGATREAVLASHGREGMSAIAARSIRRIRTDILILGSGGAGLFAALHAHQADPTLSITVAVKGLLGKCGCTRMVQGGYNVALAAGRLGRAPLHGHDRGRQVAARPGPRVDAGDAARSSASASSRTSSAASSTATRTARVHQKAFAGQTFDRTVHKGDLTGIEIINRLAEQVWARGIDRLEEHRAVELVRSRRRATRSPAC